MEYAKRIYIERARWCEFADYVVQERAKTPEFHWLVKRLASQRHYLSSGAMDPIAEILSHLIWQVLCERLSPAELAAYTDTQPTQPEQAQTFQDAMANVKPLKTQ